MVKYHIQYGKRRTIAVHINNSGKVIIKAPYNIPERIVLQFVSEKRDWINKNLARISRSKKYAHTYKPGDKFYYLGELFPIDFNESIRSVTLSNGNLIIPKGEKKAKDLLSAWFRKKARFILKKKLNNWSEIMNLSFNSLKITSAETRWGSCTSQGNVNFPFRIVMLPLEIIDYVVVHELSHLKELNHSKVFWKIVEVYRPMFKNERKWLRENSYKFVI